MYDAVARRLAAGELVILDGGTGTEIQRRGVTMDDQVWCAMANRSDADTVRAVHADYIRAGAELIIANTYASSPLVFSSLGREDEIADLDRAAVRLAREALDETGHSQLAIAGSISAMAPVTPGGDRGPARHWDEARTRALYQRKAEVLAEAGCDLLIMEMMRDLEVSRWATEAAVATGLPVWVGMTAERNATGELVSFVNQRWSLAELAGGLMASGAHAALIMHNEISTTDESLRILRSVFDGPVGAYPEVGHFEMPTWVFRDIGPADFAAAAAGWRQSGAAILGGCCGITPAHIGALRAAGIV